MKAKLLALTLALLCLLSAFPPVPLGAEEALPYQILVNRAANTVTVYTLDDAGAYTVPLKAMVCSTGRAGHETPLGTYSVLPLKKEWCLMYDGTYGQYTTAFNGDILFHSICYWAPNPEWMIAEEYNLLGSFASLGCVRLQTADAKWIFDNCAPGTVVIVYDDPDNPGPLGKPETLVPWISPEMDNGWDPTDPRPENPWPALLASELRVEPRTLRLQAGESAAMTWSVEPASAAALRPVWTSENEAVAAVADGTVVAMGEGTTRVTARVGNVENHCTVTVSGSLLPLDDLVPGAWYYGEVRYACEHGLMSGTWERQFSPDAPVSCAAAVQALYNLYLSEGGEKRKTGGEWYAPALAWAEESGISEGLALASDPERELSRQELAALLYGYERAVRGAEPKGSATATAGYADAEAIEAELLPAMRWAVSAGILKGTGGTLEPGAALTRVQLAAMLHRWMEI